MRSHITPPPWPQRADGTDAELEEMDLDQLRDLVRWVFTALSTEADRIQRDEPAVTRLDYSVTGAGFDDTPMPAHYH